MVKKHHEQEPLGFLCPRESCVRLDGFVQLVLPDPQAVGPRRGLMGQLDENEVRTRIDVDEKGVAMTYMRLPRMAFVWWGLLFEGGLGVLAWFLGWLVGQPPLESFHWSLHDLGVGVAASVPMLLGFWLCLYWRVGPLARIKAFCEEVVRPLFQSCRWYELALLCLSAGVGEEMLFRGLLQSGLVLWLGFWAGILTASALFGLMHALTPTYAILAGVMGLYLGLIWYANGNLLSAMATHSLYDFVALVYFVRSGDSWHTTKPDK